MSQKTSKTLRAAPRSAALALAIAAGLGVGALMPVGAVQANAPLPQGGYVDLVQTVSPAVVTIEVEKAANPVQKSGAEGAFPFEEFAKRFGMPMPHVQPHSKPQSGPQRGVGSGFVIEADGVIVTNAHVVEGADKVVVNLKDGRTFDAEVTGLDRATDIAVLKIDADDLPSLRFGASDALMVGQPVVAVGNPFGLGQTVTTGIVSALGRDIKAGPFDDFIQTDAAINRGNSGGPLLNDAGEVVGINTAIFSPSGGSVGLGFAVPSALAQEIVADLRDDGQVERGYLGVMIAPLSEEVASVLGFDGQEGAMISEVSEDTAAATAGLRKGDIVLEVGGEKVTSPRDMTRMIATEGPGTEVTLQILRAGERQEVAVTLGRRAEQET